MRDKHIVVLFQMFEITITKYVTADLLRTTRSRSKTYIIVYNGMLLFCLSDKKLRKLAPQHL